MLLLCWVWLLFCPTQLLVLLNLTIGFAGPNCVFIRSWYLFLLDWIPGVLDFCWSFIWLGSGWVNDGILHKLIFGPSGSWFVGVVPLVPLYGDQLNNSLDLIWFDVVWFGLVWFGLVCWFCWVCWIFFVSSCPSASGCSMATLLNSFTGPLLEDSLTLLLTFIWTLVSHSSCLPRHLWREVLCDYPVRVKMLKTLATLLSCSMFYIPSFLKLLIVYLSKL